MQPHQESCKDCENIARGCAASAAVLFREHNWRLGRASVLCYINFCVDNVPVDKHIEVYSNRKPGMTEEVQVHVETMSHYFQMW